MDNNDIFSLQLRFSCHLSGGPFFRLDLNMKRCRSLVRGVQEYAKASFRFTCSAFLLIETIYNSSQC